MRLFRFLLYACLTTLCVGFACFAETPPPGEAAQRQDSGFLAREDVRLVIYQDLALVTERRIGFLAPGPNTITLSDIPGGIIPESVHLAVKNGPTGFTLLDQTYLLGDPKPPSAGCEIVWHALAPEGGTYTLELSYLTKGLSWEVFYVAILGPQERSLDFAGRAKIVNSSGGVFPDADLKLAVKEEALIPARSRSYSLERGVTLEDGRTKEVQFLSACGIPVTRVYMTEHKEQASSPEPYGGKTERQEVKVFLTFPNRKEHSMGFDLPPGRVRIYKAEGDNFVSMVGEGRLPHTPGDAPVRLYIGNDPDISVERTVTDFKRTNPRLYEAAYSLKLRNLKGEDIELSLIEYVQGDWTILASTLPWRKAAPNSAECRLKLPKGGTAELLYRIKVSL